MHVYTLSVLKIPIARSPNLLQEAGSPGRRPQKSISQLLLTLHYSITTQFAVEMVEQIVQNLPSHYLLKRPLSIRATCFWSGLPDFQGRSPTGLRAKFHEFSTLQYTHKNTEYSVKIKILECPANLAQLVIFQPTSKWSRKTILIALLICSNVPLVMYTGLLHQRGTLDVMKYLHDQTRLYQQHEQEIDVMFLMPCHSTPYYA